VFSELYKLFVIVLYFIKFTVENMLVNQERQLNVSFCTYWFVD